MMSTEKLWKELTNDKIPWPATLLAQSCEAELKELMAQIDRMIQAKKREWELELESAKAKVKLRDQEAQLLQTTVDERTRELAQTRSRLEETEMSKTARLAEYEAQVGYLRQEVHTMTRQYERLRRKLDKQTRLLEREKERVDGARREEDGERREAERRAEEAETARDNAERQLQMAAQRAETSAAACQALEEKNAFLQTQFKSYQEQLEKRKQILEASESRFQSRLAQLEDELRTTRERLAHQSGLADRLRRSQEETAASYKKAIDERELLERDLRSSRQASLRVEEDCRRTAADKARKEQQLARVEKELAQRLDELAAAQATIRRKSEALAAAETARRPEEETRRAAELEEARESARTHKKAEKRLREEVAAANRRIGELEAYNGQLVERLARAKEEVTKAQTMEMEKTKEELKRARDALISTEENHAEQLSLSRRTQVETDERIAALLRREADAADRLGNSERRLKTAQDSGERLAAELHVANAQLEALRLENRHLRAPASSSEPLAAVRVSVRAVGVETDFPLREEAVRSSPVTPAAPGQRESELLRRIKELTEDKTALSRELEQQVDTLRRLSLENKAMASFVSGVSMALSTSPGDRPCGGPGPCGDQSPLLRQHNNSCAAKRGADDEVESLRSLLRELQRWASSMSGVDVHDGTDPTVARFLAEERERSLELENLINCHIEELKQETERTLADYQRDLSPVH